jgi:hypothetical protein
MNVRLVSRINQQKGMAETNSNPYQMQLKIYYR